MLRVVLAVLLLMGGLIQEASAQDQRPESLDLAAIVLSPADQGLESHLHAGAFDESLVDEARVAAAYRGAAGDEEAYVALLAAAGFARKHVSSLQLNSTAAQQQPEQIVRSYVTVFHTAGGAATAFAALEDESAVTSAEDLQPAQRIGEATDLTLDGGFDSESRPFRSLDLSFRIGRLIGGVTLIVYPSETGFDPDPVEVEALGAILAARMADPPEPSLGVSVARFDPAETVTYDDAYYRRDGVDLPLLEESPEASQLRTGAYGDAETVYQLFQGIGGDGALGGLYSVTLYAFASSEAAMAWMDDSQALIMTNDYYRNLTPVEPGNLTSDGSLAYTFGPFGAPPKARATLARVDNIVVRIQLVPNGSLPPAPVEIAAHLTNVQLACIEEGDCISIAVPDELTAYLNTPPESPAATPVASPAVSS